MRVMRNEKDHVNLISIAFSEEFSGNMTALIVENEKVRSGGFRVVSGKKICFNHFKPILFDV